LSNEIDGLSRIATAGKLQAVEKQMRPLVG
jgi:hypothetical protein